MKKFLLSLITSFLLSIMPVSSVYSNNEEISVHLNNSKIEFDIPPQIINGRTMVPVRAIFEALGAEVEWNDETNSAIGQKMGVWVEIAIGENIMLKNYCSIPLDTPAQLIDGRTLVPVRAIAESFGIEVNWNEKTNTVTLIDKNTLQSIKLSDTQTYTGETLDGKPFGYGTMLTSSDEVIAKNVGLWDGSLMKSGVVQEDYSNGDQFTGVIVDGQRTGFGAYYWADGDYYEGYYLNGEYNGYGEFHWANGAYYKGDFLNSEYSGYGELYYADGSYYKGGFLNDQKHGSGICYDANRDITYEAEFINGELVWPKYYETPDFNTKSETIRPNFGNVKFPLYLYSNDGETFLGKLTTNKYDSDSIFNEYGTYGSKYSSNSIFNKYGTYGSEYNSKSAFNPYTHTPPIIVDSNFKIIGYLTANPYISNGVNIIQLTQILTELNQ